MYKNRTYSAFVIQSLRLWIYDAQTWSMHPCSYDCCLTLTCFQKVEHIIDNNALSIYVFLYRMVKRISAYSTCNKLPLALCAFKNDNPRIHVTHFYAPFFLFVFLLYKIIKTYALRYLNHILHVYYVEIDILNQKKSHKT